MSEPIRMVAECPACEGCGCPACAGYGFTVRPEQVAHLTLGAAGCHMDLAAFASLVDCWVQEHADDGTEAR
jgi:hypothetical protein